MVIRQEFIGTDQHGTGGRSEDNPGGTYDVALFLPCDLVVPWFGDGTGQINPGPEDPSCRSGLDSDEVRISRGPGMLTDPQGLWGFRSCIAGVGRGVTRTRSGSRTEKRIGFYTPSQRLEELAAARSGLRDWPHLDGAEAAGRTQHRPPRGTVEEGPIERYPPSVSSVPPSLNFPLYKRR